MLVQGISCFGLTTQNIDRLSAFFQRAFGCAVSPTEYMQGADFEHALEVRGGARRAVITVGQQRIELLEFDHPGRDYPQHTSSSDTVFQHFALVVADMQRAYAALSQTPGWRPISSEGPEQLPLKSGGVTAFKFRDPDGHPLELLEFPANCVPAHWQTGASQEVLLGIDHSAIGIGNVSRSMEFYQGLGLRLAARSDNSGPGQQRLDGLSDPHLEVNVLALAPPARTPHLELLCYENRPLQPALDLESNDVAATRIVFAASRSDKGAGEFVRGELLRDPDGHHLQVR